MLNNVKTQKILGFVLGAVFTFLVFYTVVHLLGYRFVEAYKIKKVGIIQISLPIVNTNVFIDESKKIVTKKDNETITQKLSPEKHSVIVSKDGYFPWKKDLTVLSNDTIKINPIFVSQNASGNIITVKDPEYYKIKNLVDTNFPPSINNPKISSDKTVSIWTDGKEIFAKKGENTFSVIKIEGKISNIEFYKDRNDAIVFSSGPGVFVIEIYKTGGQNFMPIYKGHEPIFKVENSGFLYIYDFGALMEVVI